MDDQMAAQRFTRFALTVGATAISTAAILKVAEYFFPKLKGESLEEAISSIEHGVQPKTQGAVKLQKFIEAEILKQTAGAAAMQLTMRPAKQYPTTTTLAAADKRRVLITGGAGFVGSHVVDMMMKQGHTVYVMDNLFTGYRKNIEHWIGETFLTHAVSVGSQSEHVNHGRFGNFAFSRCRITLSSPL